MVSAKARNVNVSDFGWGIAYGVAMSGLLMIIVGTISYHAGLQTGRTDIASGRVTAVQVPNRDGLMSWKFEEVKK